MKRRSLPSGQDERKTCLAEVTAGAEALRHGRMTCTWGTEGDVAGSLSIDGKLQRKEMWKSAGDRLGRSGAIVRGSDFILQATGRVFRRDVICSDSASRCITLGGTEEPCALVKTSPVVMQQCSRHSPCVR